MTMANQKLFPAGIALNKAFCNRTSERNALKQSILDNQPVVIISPRRYGKTSLMSQVIQENQMPFCLVDFLPATDLNFVKNALLAGVGELLTGLLPLHKKLTHKMLSFFTQLNPKIVLSAMGQQVELTPQQPPQKSILDALLGLDAMAKTLAKRVVVVLDEFQQIGMLSENHEIEASIRHAVERSQQVSYVFSGSNRHLLSQMFNDKRRPFYHLCELMKLERIAREHYLKFIQAAAKKQWKKKLSDDAILEIFDLTECHTYYVNALCRKLWKLEDAPSAMQVRELWQQIIEDQYPWIADDIGALSANQRLILAALSDQPTNVIQGQTFCKKVGLIPASVKRAIDTLMEKDFVYQDKAKYYRVLDPAVLTYLRGITFFEFDKR